MNLSRFFVQTETQGTLVPGAPLVRGNNQVGLPARRTNMSNTTKVVNIRLENISAWISYLDDMGATDGAGTFNTPLAVSLRHGGRPVSLGALGATSPESVTIPSNFAGTRILADLIYSDLGYGRVIEGPDGGPVYFNSIHGISLRITPNEYGLEYGGTQKGSIQFGAHATASFYFDDNAEFVISSQAETRQDPVGTINQSMLIYPDALGGSNPAWGTFELSIFGA